MTEITTIDSYLEMFEEALGHPLTGIDKFEYRFNISNKDQARSEIKDLQLKQKNSVT